MSEPLERRRAVLSDADIEQIGQAFDKRLTSMFEVIGYDTSTPQSREDIRKDHEFVRDTRKAKGKIVGAFLGAVGTGAAALFYGLFNSAGHQ